jgi:LemA protein
MSITLIILIALGALLGYLIVTYNALASMRVRVKEAWSQIDVQLKRRADLIPNLVETVKGYASHEKEVFEKVTQARSAVLSASTPQQASDANNQLTQALKSVFAVAEAYPELKASENFLHLQGELSDTESKIAYSRQFYNAVVRDFNTKIVTFPSSLVASVFGFKEQAFFEATEAEKANVKVDFKA